MIGLGNPGPTYQGTRHNVGAAVVEELAQRVGGRWREDGGYRTTTGDSLILCLPLRFMNRSGGAVATILSDTGAAPSEMLVVCDDVNLPLGRIRLRRRGGDGGHKGLRSIIDVLGTEEFSRLRMGIGKPDTPESLEEYVLAPVPDDHVQEVRKMVQRAADAVMCWSKQGLDAAMVLFNPPSGGED